MNASPLDSTSYYDQHADDYVRNTIDLDFESLYAPFLAHLPPGGAVLDAGCGSGRDSRAFLQRGFHVTSIDASARMVELASHFLQRPVLQLRLQDLSYQSQFDGIWAQASVLHVPRTEVDEVLVQFTEALKVGGVCFLSFKEGTGDRSENGRHFTDFTCRSLETLLESHPALTVLRCWPSDDLLGRPDVKWVNALVRKLGTG